MEKTEAPGGNGLQIDFKKWGLHTITEDLLERQYQAVEKIVSFYREEQKKMAKKGRGVDVFLQS
ncbi:hypothetical protein [Desulfoluna spongiiphila]|uniref:hypothetical protein n=1 Tax=Desulfoluna spongiiphila TaxID=419481 RepID=UPI00125FB42B|nr:hypothetical protein [Desulfoluna spongiiphila]